MNYYYLYAIIGGGIAYLLGGQEVRILAYNGYSIK